jgi:hypothetical protein
MRRLAQASMLACDHFVGRRCAARGGAPLPQLHRRLLRGAALTPLDMCRVSLLYGPSRTTQCETVKKPNKSVNRWELKKL